MKVVWFHQILHLLTPRSLSDYSFLLSSEFAVLFLRCLSLNPSTIQHDLLFSPHASKVIYSLRAWKQMVRFDVCTPELDTYKVIQRSFWWKCTQQQECGLIDYLYGCQGRPCSSRGRERWRKMTNSWMINSQAHPSSLPLCLHWKPEFFMVLTTTPPCTYFCNIFLYIYKFFNC